MTNVDAWIVGFVLGGPSPITAAVERIKSLITSGVSNVLQDERQPPGPAASSLLTPRVLTPEARAKDNERRRQKYADRRFRGGKA